MRFCGVWLELRGFAQKRQCLCGLLLYAVQTTQKQIRAEVVRVELKGVMKFFHRLRDAVAPLVDYRQIKAQLGRFRTARDGGLKFRGRIGPLLGFDERSAQLIMGEGIFWEFRDGFSEQRNGFVVLLQVKVGLAQFEVCQIRAWLFLDDLFKFGHDVLIFSILSFEQGLVEQIRNFDFVLGISAARFCPIRGMPNSCLALP